MNSKTTSIMTAAALAAAASPLAAHAQMTQGPVPAAASYADLLQPIPNAVERLKLADQELASGQGGVIEAQYGYHHHHHHHHHHSRRWYMTNGYYWSGGQWLLRPRYHHHHHHHHSY